MFGKPLLQMRELDSARLLQRSRGEPAHPVVVHAKRLGDLPMLPNTGLHIFSGLFNAFFYAHWC